jgi:hypothetical protein
MSLVSNTQNDKLDLILEKLEELLNSTTSSKRGPKPKNRVVKYTRDETKYDDLHIFPFEKTDKIVKIAIIVKGEDAASVVNVEMDKFIELAENINEFKSKKTIQLYDYTPTDDVAICVNDGEWII